MGNRRKTKRERLEQATRTRRNRGRAIKARMELNEMDSRNAIAELESGLATLDKLKGNKNDQ